MLFNILAKLYQEKIVKTPSFSTIDQTGIIKSDHPVPGNGWIKGWLVDNGKHDTIIVCQHSNPSTTAPNNKVYVTDSNGKNHYRTLKCVNVLHLTGFDLDICVCKLCKPFPKGITAYKFATSLKNRQIVVTFDQYGKVSRANLELKSHRATLEGRDRDNLFDPGDSGSPWFVWEDGCWRVASHTHRGLYGIGPWYSHSDVYDALNKML